VKHLNNGDSSLSVREIWTKCKIRWKFWWRAEIGYCFFSTT